MPMQDRDWYRENATRPNEAPSPPPELERDGLSPLGGFLLCMVVLAVLLLIFAFASGAVVITHT